MFHILSRQALRSPRQTEPGSKLGSKRQCPEGERQGTGYQGGVGVFPAKGNMAVRLVADVKGGRRYWACGEGSWGGIGGYRKPEWILSKVD